MPHLYDITIDTIVKIYNSRSTVRRVSEIVRYVSQFPMDLFVCSIYNGHGGLQLLDELLWNRPRWSGYVYVHN